MVIVRAKPGYAVGAVAVNAGLWIDGMSVTFTRFENGKFDARDSYPSAYFGGMGGSRTIFGGDGRPIVGIIGKSNGNDCNGIGMLFGR